MTEGIDFNWQSTFTDITRVTVGERGDLDLVNKETRSDLDQGTEVSDETLPICNCGAPMVDNQLAHRCVQCDDLGCPLCIIRLHRRHFCPPCLETGYSLDKYVFLGLLYLKKGVADPEEFLVVDTVDGEPMGVSIDHAGSVMVDMDYLDTESGEVTAKGREALTVGKELYGEDNDVQTIVRELRILEVANRGP